MKNTHERRKARSNSSMILLGSKKHLPKLRGEHNPKMVDRVSVSSASSEEVGLCFKCSSKSSLIEARISQTAYIKCTGIDHLQS